MGVDSGTQTRYNIQLCSGMLRSCFLCITVAERRKANKGFGNDVPGALRV